jgi:cytochrome c biogenesis protein CcmG/thiol:disulfide interchange protein DsbE
MVLGGSADVHLLQHTDAKVGVATFDPMRLLAIALAGLALVACNSDDDDQASGTSPYLPGGVDAFEAYVAKQGKPVVVNKWASWCGPCRFEFPFLESQAKKRRGDVVFLGVNSEDNRGDALEFLADNPVPYDHFEDPNQEIAASFNGVQGFPVTAYYGADGEREFVHIGGYASEADLAEDIERYAR